MEQPVASADQTSENHLNKREPWDLAWQEFELVLGEKPLLDSLHLQINSLERASALLKGCGLNLNVASQRRHSERLLGESVHFLRHVLMGAHERERLPMPSQIQECDDLRVLLVMASDLKPRNQYDRLWACAILKIVHAVASLEFSGMLEDLPLARRQIFRRIKKHLKSTAAEAPAFQHPSGEQIGLAVVDWKEEKSRSSLILKLIHKSENLMDDVFDYIGVRFVVRDNHEIPLLLDALIRRDIVIPHLVIAPRSKNTLIDIGKGKKLLTLAKDLAGHGELTAEEYRESRRHVDWSPDVFRTSGDRSNRFSSNQYRSLQLTVRHLVRLKNPAHRVLTAMSMQLENYQQGIRSNHLLETLVPEENIRFYPLEIQIMDLKSYEDSKFGPSSHEKYKANQLEAARKRILGPLLALDPLILASQAHKTIRCR
jgi:uncharacterized protein (TIGR04562 family)